MTGNVVSPLTDDEYALLLIMAEGESIADLGKFSRWSASLKTLARRGFVDNRDKFNCIITEAGRAAVESHDRQVMGDFIGVANKVRGAIGAPSAEDRPIGPAVVCGMLFFKMPDGSSISAGIGEPYASQIVEMWRRR